MRPAGPGRGEPHPGDRTASQDRPAAGDRTSSQDRPATWRGALEADPLGLAGRRPVEETEDAQAPSGAAQLWAVLRLAAVIAAVIAVGFLAGVGETVVLIAVLMACIMAHEAGHLATAKAAGIKVTQFFVGFGPRLWSVRRGETEYGVRGIPLGGYCRIVGMNNLEEVAPADEARTYRQAPIWRRLTVDVAGSATHFLIAIVVLFAMFFWTGDSGFYLNSATSVPASNPIVEIDGLKVGNQVVKSPAQQAGFRPGDRIVAVDGRHFSNWAQLSGFIQDHPDVRLDVTVERGGRLLHLYPVPVNRNDVHLAGPGAPPLPKVGSGNQPVGFLGVAIGGVVHSGFAASVSDAGGAWVTVSAETLDAFGRLFSFRGVSNYVHMLTSQRAANSPSNGVRFESPVGVVRLLHQAGQQGLPTVLWLVAVINISIGIFNLLPLFPLDGGRVAVALYEAVRSRRRRPYHADLAKLLPLFYAGLALVMFLGASALFLDLRDLVA